MRCRRGMCDVPWVGALRLVRAAIAIGLAVAGAGRAAADPRSAADPWSAAATPPAVEAPPVAEPPAASQIADSAIDRARAQVLDADYQAELPRHAAGSGDGAIAGRPRRLAGGQLDDDERRRRAMVDTRALPEGGSSLVTFLMWGLVIVIAVLIASWLASELARYGGDPELEPEAETRERMQAQRAAIIDRPLGDADELARRGEFAEAIHTLLLRTLQELARSAAVRVGPATTSREILARVPLLADARTALAGLITAVEITHFGAEPANAADYERCRGQFHVFASAFRGAARGALAA